MPPSLGANEKAPPDLGEALSNSGDRTRTCDKLVNSQLLYQLSYAGSVPRAVRISAKG